MKTKQRTNSKRPSVLQNVLNTITKLKKGFSVNKAACTFLFIVNKARKS